MFESFDICVMGVFRMEEEENSNIFIDKGFKVDEICEFMKFVNF